VRAAAGTLRDRDRRTLDIALAALALVAIEINTVTTPDLEGPLVPNMLMFAGMAVPLAWRRTAPVPSTLAILFFGFAGQAVLTGPPGNTVSVLVIIFTAYSLGTHAEPPSTFIVAAIGAATITTISIIDTPDDWFFPTTFFWIAPWVGGRVMRGHTELARELDEKADRAQRSHELEQARAVAEERRRVARELHDVLAHDLSVMVVQSGAARRILERDPDAAADAARLIERTGREALTELRHLFGPARRGEGEPLEGTPGVARIERLAERARAAGLPVDLIVEGEPRPLPPGVDLAGYRVVQEALTNSLKHAGPAKARVTVRYENDCLRLEIVDDGLGEGPGRDHLGGSGHGLVGMNERVALYGGELEAGRAPDGGFRVRAALPLNGGAT
jgi:signal transduction histidine kinase